MPKVVQSFGLVSFGLDIYQAVDALSGLIYDKTATDAASGQQHACYKSCFHNYNPREGKERQPVVITCEVAGEVPFLCNGHEMRQSCETPTPNVFLGITLLT